MRLCSFPQGDEKTESRMQELVEAVMERPKDKKEISNLLGGV